jgi:YesN/AraC family two-component response regulator
VPYQILLVDDDRAFREELRECLDEYDVVEAASGPEALKLLKRPNEIDLVILDVMMPGLRGTEVLKEIKARQPEQKVIILTGYSSKDTAIDALKGRADEYLEKPLDIYRVKAAVAGLLETSELSREPDNHSPQARITRAKRFLERNWHKKVRLKDVAAVVGLSEKYLSRLFKQAAGVRFSEYALKVKIREAKKLLGNNWPVEEIAGRLGYQNSESFIRAFKRSTGRTPARYRRPHGAK